MELRHLKYFLQVAEDKNFSKAAEHLFISQPPLSRQIKELEDEIGAKLFDRNNKKVELTEAGKYFEKEVRALIQSLERITLQTQKISHHVSGEFRIAYLSSTFSGYISDLISYLSEVYPYASFKLFEMGTQRQTEALEQGKLDLGILRAPLRSANVKTQKWFEDDYLLVYNRNLINIDSDNDIEKLKDETFVFFNKDYAPHYYRMLMHICAIYGFTPNVVHESNNISSIIQLVRNGLGVSIVPGSLSKSYDFKELGFSELKRTDLFTEVLLATPVNSDSEIALSAIEFLIDKRR